MGNSGEGKVTGVGDPPCLGVKEGFHKGRTFQLRFEEGELDVQVQSGASKEKSLCKGPGAVGNWVWRRLENLAAGDEEGPGELGRGHLTKALIH